MKSRGMLFSAPMVRALLAGTKTQTRRIFKGTSEHKGPYNPAYLEQYREDAGWKTIAPHPVGSEIWVRETWFAESKDTVHYRADGWAYEDDAGSGWKPSIFMPRWASRITLKVTDVRVQRLQDISEEDAKSEGVIPGERSPSLLPHQRAYRTLWNEINGPGSWDANPFVWAYSFTVVPR